jgi:hypothetical protein
MDGPKRNNSEVKSLIGTSESKHRGDKLKRVKVRLLIKKSEKRGY